LVHAQIAPWLLLFGLLVVAPSFADDAFKMINVEDLAKLMADQPKTLAIYDANPAHARARGHHCRRSPAVVVGLLRRRQGASGRQGHEARLLLREHALNGFARGRPAGGRGRCKDVAVMADGIMGWNEAGKPTAKP